MDFLVNPDLAYLVLVTAMLSTLAAIVIPGTGIPELVAVFALLLSGYAVYHLSFTWWALLILILSGVPFVYSIRVRGREAWLALSIVGLTVGSVFFFPATATVTSVSIPLAAATTLAYSTFLWFAGRKIVDATASAPAHGLEHLIGQTGEARTAVREEGSVQVAGELWSARSDTPVAAGAAVQVVGREGFILIIEPARK